MVGTGGIIASNAGLGSFLDSESINQPGGTEDLELERKKGTEIRPLFALLLVREIRR